MNMRPLRFFAAIVDQGSIGKAADRLNISQPALSAALKALEQELGVSLFERRKGRLGLRLTPEGQQFYTRVTAILCSYDNAKAELRDMPLSRERLRIGILETLPASALETALDSLQSLLQTHCVEFWEGSVSRISGWLSQGRVDLAWTVVEEGEANTRVLWDEPFVLAMAPGILLASTPNQSVDLKALEQFPFVLRSRCEMSAAAQSLLLEAGVTIQVRWRIEREEVAFSLVEREAGITLAPKSLIPENLVAVEIAGFPMARTIGLRWREKEAPRDLSTISDELRKSYQSC
ncbi:MULTISPECIES: LysR family transcriptional regulator [unclassified Marinobacter]|uniref:LysR family transcriptional regulator n=1 Tax=unclassified Marinobacter TaxID=83889 RepID=UPI0019295837|nr:MULTISPECIES: LysR family transcriptional regulator [unclassified Marinobacter]MBL3826210.1 LysR family transcriptional regulator [Marinobacter sp. MC3]MBL3894716.1 LysR family transcriptional regulator [Marinobacter sp. MW3]